MVYVLEGGRPSDKDVVQLRFEGHEIVCSIWKVRRDVEGDERFDHKAPMVYDVGQESLPFLSKTLIVEVLGFFNSTK